MKKLSFSLLGIIVVILSVATFLEKYDGTDFVNNHIYGAWWFSSLWMILALSSFAYMLSRKLQRNLPAFLLHFSFFLILAGALLTSLTAQHGIVHLRMNEPVSAFITNEEEHIDIQQLIRTMTSDFLTEFYNFLRERGIDVSTSKCVFAGGGSLLLRGMIERGNKVAFPIFIEDIHANARGYELLYQSEVAANGQQ